MTDSSYTHLLKGAFKGCHTSTHSPLEAHRHNPLGFPAGMQDRAIVTYSCCLRAALDQLVSDLHITHLNIFAQE